ncbi:uncharacterized protein LOC111289382 [Durio zibethinus]|uniref:Uncharacterized protein LOC111289382 n=1 Tax=Durio zibethinus TaxID=66656 RepID=A0A6P5Y6P3_DURZI|nr:uncharacterized protein LOC111289382 [Durio zibethinus]
MLWASQQANARLKCIYFPIHQGKENIERILEKLDTEGCGVRENFENCCCVSICRLGRLLPVARWRLMFNPMPSKTDLAHHNPFSIALKNFSYRPQEKEKGSTSIGFFKCMTVMMKKSSLVRISQFLLSVL